MNDPVPVTGPRSWQPSGAVAAANAAATTSAAESTLTDAWRQGRPGRRHRRWSGGLLRILLPLATLALTGILIWMLLSVRRPVPILVAAAAPRASAFGIMPLLHEDLRMLGSLADTPASAFIAATASVSERAELFSASNPDEFLASLRRSCALLRPGGPDRQACVLYLATVGLLDAEGKPRLWLADEGDPLNRTDLAAVDLESVLAEVRRGIPPEVGVLVVLDCSRQTAAMPFGLDATGFAAGVQAVVRNANHDRLWVFLPSSSGQLSHTSAVERGSGFMRYLSRGLHGQADRYVHGNADGVVDLAELSAYVTDRVDHWAMAIFGERQTPLLVDRNGSFSHRDRPGTAASLRLSWAAAEVTADVQLPDIVEYPADGDWWIRDRWTAAERLRERGLLERPTRWAAYELTLLLSERLRGAGSAYDSIQVAVDAEVERLESVFESPILAGLGSINEYNLLRDPSVRAAADPAAAELAAAAVERAVRPPPPVKKPDAAQSSAGAPRPADAPATGSATKPESSPAVDSVAEAVVAAPAADPTAPDATPPVAMTDWNDRLVIFWDWYRDQAAAGKPLTRDELGRWLTSLGTSPEGMVANPLQVQFLRLMHRWAPDSVWQGDAALIVDGVMAIDRSLGLLLAKDPRVGVAERLAADLRGPWRDILRAIDLTFVGEEAARAEARQLLASAAPSLDAMLDGRERLGRGFQTLDLLSAELPYLAAWWSGERRHGEATGRQTLGGQLGEFDWQQLVEDFRRLQATLQSLLDRSPDGDRSMLLATLERLVQRCVEQHGQLRSGYVQRCLVLATEAADTPATHGGIQRVLTTPLVTGELRMRLLHRAIDLERRFVSAVARNREVGGEPLAVPNPLTALAGWLQRETGGLHPAASCMLDETPAAFVSNDPILSVAGNVGRHAAALRDAARSLPEFLARLDQKLREVDSLDGDHDSELFGILNRGNSVVRRLAVAVCRRPDYRAGDTPSRKLLATAWHTQLVQHADLLLHAFFGGLEPDEGDYTLDRVRRLVDVAETAMKHSGLRFTTSAYKELRNRWSDLVAGGVVYADITLDPRQFVVAATADQSSPEVMISLQPRLAEAEGLAAVWISESVPGNPLPVWEAAGGEAVARRGVPIGRDADRPPVSLAIDPVPGRGLVAGGLEVVDLTAFFRGRRLVRPARLVAAEGGRTIRWRRPEAWPPRVVVHGSLTQPRAVAVVFDCSGSMGRRMADGRTRIDAGRTAIGEVLSSLAMAGQWDVSFWLYGHRTQWSRTPAGRYEFRLTAAGEEAKRAAIAAGRPFPLVPGDDVEQIVPMQRLTPGLVERITSLLAGIGPGGETPLYRAISEAVGTDFDGPRTGIPGHVLVVTDGANDQSGGRIVTVNALEDQLARKNARRPEPIRVDIIGFGLEADAMRAAMRMADARNLAVGSGGSFAEAGDVESLVRSLRTSLRMVEWQVTGPGAPESAHSLEEPVMLPPPVGGQVHDYDASLLGAARGQRRFAAENGAAVELFMRGEGRELVFRRYDGGTEQGLRDSRGGLLDPEEPRRRVFVGAHMADRTRTTLLVPISVQNDDATSYSPRPAEAWIEIIPSRDGKPVGPAYVWYEASYQPARPVPVIECRAENWPDQAVVAEVRAWFRFQPTPPDLAISIAELIPEVDRSVAVEGLTGVRFTLRLEPTPEPGAVALTVLEEHSVHAGGRLPICRVTVPKGCREATHTVEQGTGRVRHRFLLDAQRGVVSSLARLEITDREKICRGAVTTVGGSAGPLVVPVPRP